MRRFLLIVLILILAAGAVWYIVVRPKQVGTETSTGGFRSFFSLGNDTATNIPSDIVGVADTGAVDTAPNDPFTLVSPGPVAGYTTFTETRTVTVPATDPNQKPTKQIVTDHVVRYVSRANGYVYEVRNGETPIQITNIFIPNIYEAYFVDNNQTVILRFLRDDNQTIATYSVPIPGLNPDGTRTQQTGTYFPDDITSFTVAPDQKSVARLTSNATTASVTTSNSKGGGVKEIVQSPFHEWLLQWANQPYVQTKAAASASGFLYRIDTAAKRLVRILGTVPGLTTSVSPSGSYVLYSESTTNGFATHLFNTKTGSAQNITVSILPEKCVWVEKEDAICAGTDAVVPGTYPDDWYKGTLSFSDKLYRIYSTGGLIDSLNNGDITQYDMVYLSFDADENRLYFVDKKTGLLWYYAL